MSEQPGAADRRREILDAAAGLFATHGFAATRVADIAAKAGVAKGLVFWYFGSKGQLLEQIAATVENNLLDLVQAVVAGVPTPLERLYVATMATVYYIDEHYHLYAAISLASRGRADSPFRAAMDVHLKYTSTAIERWQGEGAARRSDSAQDLAYALAGVINEMVRLRRQGVIRRSVAQTAAMAARFAVHGVAADPAEAEAAIAAHPRLVRRASAIRRRAG